MRNVKIGVMCCSIKPRGGAVKAVCVITLLMEGCDRPETSLPHDCAFLPVAKYLSVVITLWLYRVGLEMGVYI